MSRFYNLEQAPLNLRSSARAIAAANNGLLFDPSDLSTLYQDAAGTTPVTAVEQPVGLMLDKSQGLMLGPELVSNGGFSDGSTGWALGAGWSISGGKLIGTSASGNADGTAGGVITSKFYLVKYSIESISTGGNVSVNLGGSTGVIRNSAGLYSEVISATTIPTLVRVQPRLGSAPTVVIDNISVKELYGNHATQSITASRPTLSARYNLLTKTEDFSDAAWGRVGVTVSGRTISFSASNTSRVLYAITGGGNFTISCRFSEADAGKIIRFGFWASGLDGLGNGNSLDIVIPQNGFVSFSKSNVVSLTNVGLINASSGVAQSVTLMNGFGISLTTGTTSGQYQRVNTATDYDTDPRYFKKYLRFDGVDDYLNLPYMGLYAGGEMSIIAARNVVSQATDTYIISERSTTDADPKYFPSRQIASGDNMDAYISDDVAAVILDTTGSAFGGAADKVIRSVVDTGNNLKLYKNGGLAADDNYTRAGTLTLNNTTLGASVSTTTGNYASMKLYGLIITKKALSPAQRIKCERYAASKAGVIL